MLLTTMIIRTLLCKPQEIDAGEFKARDFDKDLIAKHLSEAVQIPTVSMVGEFEGQDKPFHDYHAWLEKTYPLIHKTAEKTVINNYSLVYRFKGKNPTLAPGAFLAHQDVVPAPKEGWDYEPFGGTIDGGFIWGRGTQDMKGTMIQSSKPPKNFCPKDGSPNATFISASVTTKKPGRKKERRISARGSNNKTLSLNTLSTKAAPLSTAK